MKAYLTLMRLSLRNKIGAWRRDSWYKPSGKLDVSRIVTTAMVLLSFAYLAGLMIFVEVKLFGVLASMGQPMLLMALALMLGMVSTLMLGIFITVSSLYFQRDSAWLAYLPVSPYAVLGMRWTGLWAGDAALNAVFIAPAALLYGLHTGADVLYYLRMLAIILATPLIPLAISTLLTSLLSRATVLFRHKDAMAMIGSLLIVFVVALRVGVSFDDDGIDCVSELRPGEAFEGSCSLKPHRHPSEDRHRHPFRLLRSCQRRHRCRRRYCLSLRRRIQRGHPHSGQFRGHRLRHGL